MTIRTDELVIEPRTMVLDIENEEHFNKNREGRGARGEENREQLQYAGPLWTTCFTCVKTF